MFPFDLKPPHHDEGVSSTLVAQINDNGFYHYSPDNYHGPLHYYAIFLTTRLFGDDVWPLRLPCALAGSFIVFLIYQFHSFFGKKAAFIAALFAAVSPGLVYYARQSTHDTELVFFTILALWGWLSMMQERKKRFLWFSAMGLTGMILIKESFLICVAVYAIAFLCTSQWELPYLRKLQPRKPSAIRKDYSSSDVLLVAGFSAFLILFFYSGTFMDIKNLPAFFKTFTIWAKTGTEKAGHVKPFLFWASLFTKYEWPALLGLLSVPLLFFVKSVPTYIRLIGLYGVGILLVYSLIPYKTPWCITNLLWPNFLALGYWSALLLRRHFVFVVTSLVILFLISVSTCVDINFIRFDDPKEGYFYVRTSRDVYRLTGLLHQLTKKNPAAYNLQGYILGKYPWPMPWLLKPYKKVAWFDKYARPSSYDADFLIVDKKRDFDARENLTKPYFVEQMRIRSDEEPVKLYLSPNVFGSFFAGRSPEFQPKPKETHDPHSGLRAPFYVKETSHKPATRVPALEKTIPTVDFAWDMSSRPFDEPFETELTGEILIPQTRKEFLLITDDGGSVEIDGQKIIQDPGPHASQEAYGTFIGNSDWKKIKITHYDIGGGAVLRLLRKDADNNFKIVPADHLRPAKDTAS